MDNKRIFLFCALFLGCAIVASVAATANQGEEEDPRSANPAWAYKCERNKCVKVEANDRDVVSNLSRSVCLLFCGPKVNSLWPYPTGEVRVGKESLIRIDPYQVMFDTEGVKAPKTFQEEHLNFMNLIESTRTKKDLSWYPGSPVRVQFDVDDVEAPFHMDMDQKYTLNVTKGPDGDVNVLITAANTYGVKYALVTLSQLIVYDDFRRELLITSEAFISDAPAFQHRGLVLDTSRNYFSVQSIKRTIHAMSLSKLNVFHWHITDSHSFPLVVKEQPDLSKFGAYSPDKIYTAQDVREIVEYGRIRGVAVIPEFDAPAHVGEGWQKKDLTACFNAQPWKNYCVEPPCGQLDPTEDRLYDVLEDIYRTMWTEFGQPHLFHMGGDEVSVSCWNSSARIRQWMTDKGWQLEEKDFMRLWGHFQDNAMLRLDKVMGSEQKRPIVLWTSRLTDVPYVNEYVDKERTIIQIWTKGDDPKVADLLSLGFKVIVSNYDALYLDCGFAGWVTGGNNWCAPYIGWQKIYSNTMESVAGGNADLVKQVLGAEAALWSEQADEHTLDARMWPRASAMAERLWSNPSSGWRDAETRMLWHREVLVKNGIAAEALEPEWCLANEDNCPI